MKIITRNPLKAAVLTALFSLSAVGVWADDTKKKKPVLTPKEAVETRKAAFNLVGKTFKPIGGILKGEVDYKSVDVEGITKRLVVLNEFFHGTFGEDTNVGEPQSKARAEIWTKKDEFKKRFQDFRVNVEELAAVAARDNAATDAFKAAAQKVAQDCKGCHDNFKHK